MATNRQRANSDGNGGRVRKNSGDQRLNMVTRHRKNSGTFDNEKNARNSTILEKKAAKRPDSFFSFFFRSVILIGILCLFFGGLYNWIQKKIESDKI